MPQQPEIRIWEGSGSFIPGESTPYGYFDNDIDFMISAERTALWVTRRLGYPVQDVELVAEQIFAAFEEATMTYSTYINNYEARENLMGLIGQSTGSLDLSSQYVRPNLNGMFKLANEYATPVGSGGNLTYYTGSVNLKEGVQVYDLNKDTVTVEAGDFTEDNFTIRRVFFDRTSPLGNFIDPSGFSGLGNQEFLNQFGWGDYGVQFTLMPLNYDLMRMQAVEMHNQIRKSTYSFQLTANRLRLFPIPKADGKLHFLYTLDSEEADSSGNDKITNMSNVPYAYKKYQYINSMGRNWIKRYTLALCKEILGLIRSKYSDIPMTGDINVSLNGSDLLSQASSEIENLVRELTEFLETTSRSAALERKRDEAEALAGVLKWVPSKIYVK